MSDEPLDLSSLDLNSEPSPPTSSFDLLPPELVIDIVELACSSQNRRETLRALCLTSRYLRSISQPLLLSHVDLKYDREIACLVEKNSSDALAMIRTITLIWRKPMKSAVTALAEAATSLEALTCFYQSAGLEPFAGSNIKFLALHGCKLNIRNVPLFQFHHIQFMELSRCKFYGQRIRFDLPSLRHLVYTPDVLWKMGSTDSLHFFNQIAPSLVSISVRISTSLPESIVKSPSISLYRRADISQAPNLVSLQDFQALHLDTASLTNVADHAYTLAGVESWSNLLKVRLKPEVLLLTQVQVSDVYLESVKKLEEVCRYRGIEVVWENSRSIHPTFTFGSRWFIEWSEKRHKEKVEI
ncbi:hypothetical protein JCM3765_004047 [Sporobolomyces pararoseus]